MMTPAARPDDRIGNSLVGPPCGDPPGEKAAGWSNPNRRTQIYFPQKVRGTELRRGPRGPRPHINMSMQYVEKSK